MTHKPESVHLFTSRLSSLDIDAGHRAKPSAIANVLQEAAREHADKLGWGVETLHEKKKYWVLSRIEVTLNSRPAHAQVVSMTTWPKGTHGLFALRDFSGTVNGQEFLRATSSWAMLDALSGRPLPVDDLSDLFMERKEEHALKEPARRIFMPEDFRTERKMIPVYTDLDEIGHVNNARYLDWAWSELSQQERKATTGWTVNYLKEVREGQTLNIKTGEIDNEIVVTGIREDDKPAFLVSFHLR